MRNRIRRAALLGSLFCFAPALPALAEEAQEGSYPRLEAEINIEIENDWNFESDDPDNEYNDLYTTTEPAFGLYLLPGLSLQSGLVLEPVADPEPGESRAFEDHGLYVEQLYLLYEQAAFGVFGGKFNPTFGIAWDVTPGVYGTDVAGDFYEQTERIGLGGSLVFGGAGLGGDGFGEHKLTAQTFFADTTVLSESLGEDRPRVRKSDGGPGNTEDFSSFSVTLDGGGFEGVPGEPGYHLGVLYRSGGEGDPEDELGFAAALTGTIEGPNDVRVEPLVEYVHFDNAEAQDQDRDIVTAALGFYHGPWNLALAYSQVWSDPNDPALDDLDVKQVQISAGHSFDFGLDVDVGYKFNQEEAIDSHTVGVLFHYAFDFAAP